MCHLGASRLERTLIERVEHILTIVSIIVDYIGIVLILIGAAKFAARAVLIEMRRLSGLACLHQIRENRLELGGYILAALEFMIISDIIMTALTRELHELYFLALLVAVRTAIGFFLNMELKDIRKEDEQSDG